MTDTADEEQPIDLERHADVAKGGHSVGVQLMDQIKEAAMSMDQEQRIVFYMALLLAPVRCMKASIGTEATMAILDRAKEYITNG